MPVKSFKYRGVAYPFLGTPGDMFTGKSDIDVLRSSIRNILLTPRGRQPWNPEYGSLIPLMIGENKSVKMPTLVAYYARKALSTQEPRIELLNVTVKESKDNQNTISINVFFRPFDVPETDVSSVEVGL